MSWNAFSGWDHDSEGDATGVPRELARIERFLLEMTAGRRPGRESNTSQLVKDELLVRLCGWPTRIEKLESENDSTNGVVDYLLRMRGVHVHLEVKRAGRALDDDQVCKYLRGRSQQPFEFGLLTNGLEWRLFAKVGALSSAGAVALGTTTDLTKVSRMLMYAGMSERLRKALLASTPLTRALCRTSAGPQDEFEEAFAEFFGTRAPMLSDVVERVEAAERAFKRRPVGPRFAPDVMLAVAAMRHDAAVAGFKKSFRSLVGFKRINTSDVREALRQALPLPHEIAEANW